MRLVVISAVVSCRKVVRYLDAYLDGEVDLTLAAAIGRHLDDCRRCGLEADVYTSIKHSIAGGERAVDQVAVHRLEAFARRLGTSAE